MIEIKDVSLGKSPRVISARFGRAEPDPADPRTVPRDEPAHEVSRRA